MFNNILEEVKTVIKTAEGNPLKTKIPNYIEDRHRVLQNYYTK